jgi:ectoine hydroxylase-related dioxygenase (phytanoyl-CoA dioxygenase family)
MTTTLTPQHIADYRTKGYLIGLPPVYTTAEMQRLNADLPMLMNLLKPGETPKDIREWHETSRYLYDICMNPRILDLVEGIVGPNFFFWGSNFFIKAPHSTDTVGWHQDAYYWPMSPHNTVTVWLAFSDVDVANGAMQLIPGSHLAGLIQHQRSAREATDSVLTLQLDRGSFREDSAVPMVLRAGEVSLHDDRAVHGSAANSSDRPRVGLTIRYSGTEVKNDLAINPHFKAALCRGSDRYHHNPVCPPPQQRFARPHFTPISIEEAGVPQ